MDFQPMSPEDMQRTMQFLLNQQAQFAADSARRSEEQAANDARWTERFERISDGLVGLTSIVGQLAAAQQRTDEQLKVTGERVDDLGEYIRSVESHLNVVIEMFERHLREDHGRRPS